MHWICIYSFVDVDAIISFRVSVRKKNYVSFDADMRDELQDGFVGALADETEMDVAFGSARDPF